MNPSVASIIAALISAAASVIVALIGKTSPARASRQGAPQRIYVIPSKNKRAWIIGILILFLWLLFVPTVIHWDLASLNFLTIFVVTILFSCIWPVKPWGAAAVVLMLFSANFFMEPLGWWVHGIRVYFPVNKIYLLIVSSLGLVNAVGAWGLARWRGRRFIEIAEAETKAQTPQTKPHQLPTSLADEIAKLNDLRESGALSDEEFQRAKKKLLGD